MPQLYLFNLFVNITVRLYDNTYISIYLTIYIIKKLDLLLLLNVFLKES